MRSALNFNVHEGNLEAMVHGYRNGFIKSEEYNNLTQCDTLGDLKSQLQVTDYGNFLQNESVLTSRVIAERATEKLCNEFREIREWCDQPLGKFLDFISYDYMISNVLKLIAGARHSRDSLDILYKCHPLGLFDGIAALTAATSVEEMYETVLIDSPIGPFFGLAGTQPRDFDELSIEYIRGVLQKNYLEAFYDFVLELGGETAEVMGRVLSFEADRLVVSVASNTAGLKDLLPEDRKKLFPNFGTLVDVQDDLAGVQSSEQIAERLKNGFAEYADLFEDTRSLDSSGGKSIEKKLTARAVEVYRDALGTQFQYGVFYGWVKLKEMELNNLVWIGECITQNMKHRVHEYVPVA
jgi:V-type H+-transporting ATPase subunit d